MAIVVICFSDSYDALEKTKDDLKALKLKDFPGENVPECSATILVLAEWLDSGGAFNDQLLCTIMRIYEGASDEKFRLWAMNGYKTCSDFIKRKRLGMTTTQITYQDICREADMEYQALIDSNRWSLKAPAKSNKPGLPKAYVAQIEKSVTQAIKQAGLTQVSKTEGTSNKKGKKKVTCHNCGKEGHIRPNCPDLDKNKKKNSNGTQEKQKWYLQPPRKGQTTRLRFGKTYNWCTKCTPPAWRFHSTETHDDWAKRQTEKEGNAPAKANLAALQDLNNQSDDFISFGGLTYSS